MAVANRNRCGSTILHSDHGSQFTSWSFGENVQRWGLLASFGTIGDCYDNAAMEAFWARMQVELLNTRKWATTLELAGAMADNIDNFYNVERRHSYRQPGSWRAASPDHRSLSKHFSSMRLFIRQPSGVRSNSSTYQIPRNKICFCSALKTIGLKQTVRDDAVSPSTRTSKLPSMW
jgi:hypothetical protein